MGSLKEQILLERSTAPEFATLISDPTPRKRMQGFALQVIKDTVVIDIKINNLGNRSTILEEWLSMASPISAGTIIYAQIEEITVEEGVVIVYEGRPTNSPR